MTKLTTTETTETHVDRALRALLPATRKFQERLVAAIQGREIGWHRLAVKVDRGKLAVVQLVTDEQLEVIKSPENSVDAGGGRAP